MSLYKLCKRCLVVPVGDKEPLCEECKKLKDAADRRNKQTLERLERKPRRPSEVR